MANNNDNQFSTTNRESSEVSGYLEGAAFPADKGALTAHASQNGAPENVLQLLDGLPDKEYRDIAEVLDEING